MDIHEIAAAIAGPGPNLRLRKGKVTAVAADGTLSVQIAGSTTTITGVKALASLCPKVNAGVWLATDGADLFAVGTIAPVGPAYVRCVKSGDHSINTSSWTAINWNSVAEDTHGMWSSGTSSRITCQVPGVYVITGEAVWVSNATGDRAISIQLNGDSVMRTYDRKPANSGYVTMSFASIILPLAAGDYVNLMAWHNAGTAITITGDERTYLQACWLRPPT